METLTTFSPWKVVSTLISCDCVRFIFAVAKYTTELCVNVRGSWQKIHCSLKETHNWTFLFLERLKSPPWAPLQLLCDEGLAEGHDVSHKAEWAHVSCQGSRSVSCFLAGTGSGGVNRGNPTCWRGNSTMPSYTPPAGTLETTSLSLYPMCTHTHTHTHAWMHCWPFKHI